MAQSFFYFNVNDENHYKTLNKKRTRKAKLKEQRGRKRKKENIREKREKGKMKVAFT